MLTGDIKAVDWELLAGDPNGQRRLSSIEAAFNHASIPWPTCGLPLLWGPGAKPHGHKWPCTFVVLPDPQCQWLATRHGSIDVILANIGLEPKDQTWHFEQWLHLKLAARKRRRDASQADSKSRQKVVPHPKSRGWASEAQPFWSVFAASPNVLLRRSCHSVGFSFGDHQRCPIL